MPIDFLISPDLNGNEILNARLQNLGTDPTGLGANDKGLIWISAAGTIKFWDGSNTQTLGLATGGNAETLDGEDGTFYLSRANHTGTQVAATISDLPEAVQDLIGGMLTGTQTGITVSYDDTAGTLSFVTQVQDQFIESVTDTATLDLTVTADALSGTVLDSPTVGGATPAQLRDRSTHTGAQAISTITGLQTALDGKADDAEITALDGRLDTAEATLAGLGTAATEDATTFEHVANKGAANGYASLDGTGKVPSAQLPALALTDVHVVADNTARDALTVQEGDVAIVTGDDTSYIYDGTQWQELVSPTDGVTAVTGGTGITSTGGTAPEISITAGGVGPTELADDAVTAAKLADASVELNTATTTGTLPIGKGGTGATTAAAARAALAATTKVSANIGNGTDTEYTVTHNLGTRDVTVEVYRNSTPWDKVLVDVERPSTDSVLIRFAAVQAADSFRVVVVG